MLPFLPDATPKPAGVESLLEICKTLCMEEVLQSERLILRPLRLEDAESFVRLQNNAGKLKAVDWFTPFLDSNRPKAAANGYDFTDQDLGSAAPDMFASIRRSLKLKRGAEKAVGRRSRAPT